ncbi:MAG: AMP-dependent synthetase and ligase [Chloroflexi bacterium]|jgi:fatty-acyl-CoA synthase|nr:AMP-dependent synthetase and ligase [Chloroflexota bacterium]
MVRAAAITPEPIAGYLTTLPSTIGIGRQPETIRVHVSGRMSTMPAPSYVHGAHPVPLLGETIGENLRRTVQRFAGREALVVRQQGYRATYGELWEQVGEAARGLMARGVGRGDRVGIWSPNRSEWVVAQYATARIGAILVNINPAYRTAELEYALNQSGVSFLILARAFRQADYVGMLGEVRGRCPELREALVLEDGWEALLRDSAQVSEEELAERESALQFDDAINIQYTSGTTGFPKGATLSHHSILNNGFFVGEALRYTEADRVCIPVPFYHCFGMVLGNLACTTHGSTIVVPGEAYDPVAVMETVQAERCSSLYGVPTMFIGELDHPRFSEFDFSSLRTGIMAGSPCPVEVMKRVQSTMCMAEVTIAYGMTETSPVSTQSATDDPLDKRVSTVGRIHPHVEIKVVDPETGAVVPRGERGELCTRGYNVMLGYWNNEEATRAAIDAGGWMHTGDLAVMDGDGYLNIVGRIKDMIIRGGENIYPREIEEFLYGHPDVSDVQVIGVPSERYGEEVMAWVRLREGAAITGDQLTEHCRGRIAGFKIPRYWKFVDEFPMTVTGKIQKFRMREAAVEELGLQVAAGVRTA